MFLYSLSNIASRKVCDQMVVGCYDVSRRYEFFRKSGRCFVEETGNDKKRTPFPIRTTVWEGLECIGFVDLC